MKKLLRLTASIMFTPFHLLFLAAKLILTYDEWLHHNNSFSYEWQSTKEWL